MSTESSSESSSSECPGGGSSKKGTLKIGEAGQDEERRNKKDQVEITVEKDVVKAHIDPDVK